ncbi:hypothetical protein VTJ04DRAFT_10504 [Mycothermus thermophilus]|uniref:uncharacterized protein n=1 Tax=Humicola insolens TaxID=85995 RepID=UPI0037435C8F
MRYDDWDVIFFPTGRDSKIPFKEFKVACHVVSDLELAHLHGPVGTPVMTCFVPSLPPGAGFQISIHCWRKPALSQFSRTYSKHTSLIKFEARILIDGRQVASTILDRDVNGPHLITSTCEFTKTGELERLKFPLFRRELLYQNHWRPGDNLGRIKIIISEGFPRDSLTAPIERVKNVVAFSFQHAPLEILEANSIAWPNQAMWHTAPFASTMPVPTYQAEDGPSSHTHSPNCKSIPLRNLKTPGFPAVTMSTPMFDNSAINTGFGGLAMCMGAVDFSNPGTTGVPPSSDPCAESTYNGLDDETAKLGVPANTPIDEISEADSQNAVYSTVQQAHMLPADFASPLGRSLLNQPFPVPRVPQTKGLSAMDPNPAKHNEPILPNVPGTDGMETCPTSQAVVLGAVEAICPPQPLALPAGDANRSSLDLAHENDSAFPTPTNTVTSDPSCGKGEKRSAFFSGGKGSATRRRTRNFTPASDRAIDEADEPRRMSPQARGLLFGVNEPMTEVGQEKTGSAHIA